MTRKAWHAHFKKKKRLYRTDAEGITHDTVSEMNRWKLLQQWQLAGEIRCLDRQVKYELSFVDQNGVHRSVLTPTGKIASYTADFVYEKKQLTENSHGIGSVEWVEVIEDHKGFYSRDTKFRIAVFEALYGVKVHISKAKSRA